MVELADTQDLGSCIARCAGSSPVIRTKDKQQLKGYCLFYYSDKINQDLK